MVLWVSMFYAAVPNGTCKQGWGLSSWGAAQANQPQVDLGHPSGWPDGEDGVHPYLTQLSFSSFRPAVTLNDTSPEVHS